MRLAAVALATTTSIIAAVSSAYADGPEGPRYIYSPSSWTGVYFGIQGGYDWGSGSFTHLADSSGIGPFQPIGAGGRVSSLQGGFIGGQLGYQKQFSNWVLGVEASAVGTNLKRTVQNPYFAGLPIFDRYSINSVGSLIGRIGYAPSDKWLVYGKGGLATGFSEYKGFCEAGAGCAPTNFNLTVGDWHKGWTAGGGVDYKLARNFTIGLDYSYVRLDTQTSTNPYPQFNTILATYRHSADAHLVGIRLNYLIGADPEPAPLK
jgi:outer membrane immunogenic protein